MLSKLLPVLVLFCLSTFAPGIFPLFPLYEDVTSVDCVTSVKTALVKIGRLDVAQKIWMEL